MVIYTGDDSKIITSFNNPLVKRIRRLSQKKYRREEQAFFAEGLRVVLSAIDAGSPVETLIYCPELLRSEIGWNTLEDQTAGGVMAAAVSEKVFRRISSRDNPVGIGAVLRTTWSDHAGWRVNHNSIFAALDRISEPGNLGTICRTLDAIGGAGLLLVGESADPFHPRSVKASMGAIFTTPIASVPTLELVMEWARTRKVSVVASSAGASLGFREVRYKLPALLIAGSEGTGLSHEILDAADMAVRIPMEGSSTSLNLAVAVGILLYELRLNSSAA